MKKLLLALTLIAVTTGCSKIENSIQKFQNATTGGIYKVTLYSGGKVVREWNVKGFVSSEEGSDGYYFDIDGKLVQVTGDLVIEQLD